MQIGTSRFDSRRCQAAIAWLVAVVAAECLGQAPLSAEQKQRLDSIRALQDRASGVWENANYSGVVKLVPNRPSPLDLLRAGAVGTWRERKRNGEAVADGTWLFREGGQGELRFSRGGEVDAVLVGEHLLALQPYTRAGGLLDDGVVLFREKFDFEGHDCRVAPATDDHKRRIVGKWTHANIETVHEATPVGQWVERRKKGGIHAQGIWQHQQDGSFLVQYENNWKLRVWTTDDGRLVVITFKPDGAMSGDGMLLKRD